MSTVRLSRCGILCCSAERGCDWYGSCEAFDSSGVRIRDIPEDVRPQWKPIPADGGAHEAPDTLINLPPLEIIPAMTENPKEAPGAAKAPLDYLEPALDVPLAHVMKHGADKYGRRNYTITPCKLTTYIAAIQRHLLAVRLGEDIDPDSGQPHLAHIAACCAVVLACADAGHLVDDREAAVTDLSNKVHQMGDMQAKAEKPVDTGCPVADACDSPTVCKKYGCARTGFSAPIYLKEKD